MANFNFLNVRETAGAGRADRQAYEMNAMKMDAARQEMAMEQQKFDDAQRLQNTKWLAAASKYAMENPGAMPALVDEGKRRGIFRQDFMPPVADPQQLRESLKGVYDSAMAQLGQAQMEDMTVQDTPYAQRDPITGEITQVGATPKGPSSPIQNYRQRQDLVRMYGEGSPQVKTFDAYVRAPQYQDINQVPTQITPSGTQPLSTLESELNAANRMEMSKGEGGRGREQTPTGEFVPVPGTQADVEAQEDIRKRAAGAYMKSIQAQTVVEDTTRLRLQIQSGKVPFGKEAALQEKLDPLLQSKNYRNAISLIESVKGNVGIDSLLRIKASGAGLGQVPQTQLDMLSRLLGELDLKQSEEQFTRTWNRMEQIYTEIMNTADDELAALEQNRPDIFKTSTAVQEKLLEQARQAIREGRSSRAAVEQKLIEMGIDPGLL